MPTRDDHRGRWGALAYVLHPGAPLKLEKRLGCEVAKTNDISESMMDVPTIASNRVERNGD